METMCVWGTQSMYLNLMMETDPVSGTLQFLQNNQDDRQSNSQVHCNIWLSRYLNLIWDIKSRYS
jgi:hypothetical protein